MIPYDVLMAPSFRQAWQIWGDPRWSKAGAPRPSLALARRVWLSGAPLRDLQGED